MVYILFLSILLLLILSFYATKKDFISPAFIFSFGFFFQSIWVMIYSNKWDLSLHINTYLVITLGIAIFIGISKLTSMIYDDKNGNNNFKIEYIHIDKWKKILFLIFSILVSIWYLDFIVKSVGGNIFDFKNIAQYISEFDKTVKFSENFIKTPFLIGNMRTLVLAVGTWFIYITINNFICKRKIEFYNISIITVSMLLSLLNGSRTPLFFMISSGLVYFLLITFINNKQKNKKFDSKILLKVGIVGVVFLCLFGTFAKMLGRNIKENPADYLAIYCGAEVKNLDMFLQENHDRDTQYFGAQTFQPLITSIGRKINSNLFEYYKLDLPFRKVGEYNLGNVYTTFYPYIYDFGYSGLVFFVMVMALISQVIYEKAKKLKNGYPTIWTIAYGSVFSCLLLSFFSNKFYETIFTTDFIKKLIIWYLCTLFFCKIDFKEMMKKIKIKK